jgi:hypothetical protein
VKFFKPVVSGLGALLAAALLMSTPLFVSMLRYPAKDGYFFVVHWHVWAVRASLLWPSQLVFTGSTAKPVNAVS